MALIKCPDCERQISDRVEACPFCGCPAKYFKESSCMEECVSEEQQDDDILEEFASENKIQKSADDITFKFWNANISYPQCIEKYANIYGFYVQLGKWLYKKYVVLYENSDNISVVLGHLTDLAEAELESMIDKAISELYSSGVMISRDKFISEYDIDFKDEIAPIYRRIEEILKEEKQLVNQRDLKKASRGKWEGGGFGLSGALKGVAIAGVLNASAEILHSIGDGAAASKDERYIISKIAAVYDEPESCNVFAMALVHCSAKVLNGIKNQLAMADAQLRYFFENQGNVDAIYESTIKYEKNHEKLFANMIKCISINPLYLDYYKPIVNDLFSENCELEQFLKFWNLALMLKELEVLYVDQIMMDTNNPFVDNRCRVAIKIKEQIDNDDGTISIVGQVIKGTVLIGQELMFTKMTISPIISAIVIKIEQGAKSVNYARTGVNYSFTIDFNDISVIRKADLLVDTPSFEADECNLYAIYEKDGQEIVWGFIEESKDKTIDSFSFTKENHYVSNRKIGFCSTIAEIKVAYGNVVEQEYFGESDIVYAAEKKKKHSNAEALIYAKGYLTYRFNDKYSIRFYYDKNKTLLLVAYLKNMEIAGKDLVENQRQSIASKLSWNIRCLKCKRLVNSNSKFCNFCGTPVPRNLVICPYCKKKIKKGVKFCNFCGKETPKSIQGGMIAFDLRLTDGLARKDAKTICKLSDPGMIMEYFDKHICKGTVTFIPCNFMNKVEYIDMFWDTNSVGMIKSVKKYRNSDSVFVGTIKRENMIEVIVELLNNGDMGEANEEVDDQEIINALNLETNRI